MQSLIGFLIMLGPLVVVHEFGHYIFARIFGVKAEIFSIGFGPTLWKRQMGETELRLSAIPLGGYVKLLGEDRESQLSAEEAKRSLHRQVPWKRFFIFFGGPLFNFLFAILVYMSILAIGEPQLASVAGRVVRGSVAEKAGFLSGDRILSVNGKPVRKYEEIIAAVSESPGKEIRFEVRHPGRDASVEVRVTPGSQPGFSVYGEQVSVGEIEGLSPMARSGQVGISDPASEAAKAGFKTGDFIIAMNGAEIANWEEFERKLAALPAGSSVSLKAKRPDGSLFETQLALPAAVTSDITPGAAWGLHSSELFVDKTVPESPAEAAGVKKGDRLVGVSDVKVQSFLGLKDAVQQSGEKTGKVPLSWEQEGKTRSAELVPTATSGRDPVLKKTTQYTVGVIPMWTMNEPETVVERVWNPITLMIQGTERMVVSTYRNFVSLGKMLTGEVSAKTLGGPILIGKIAGESMSRGLIPFLSMMAILSIGLGVLNILPVPVLDGGHIMLLGVEALRRKPLTMRQMEKVQGFGLVLVLALMGFVFFNDLTRLSSSF